MTSDEIVELLDSQLARLNDTSQPMPRVWPLGYPGENSPALALEDAPGAADDGCAEDIHQGSEVASVSSNEPIGYTEYRTGAHRVYTNGGTWAVGIGC